VVEMFLQESGLTLKQLEERPEGMWYGDRCYDITEPKQIRTPSRKIEIYSETLAEAGYDPIPSYKEPTQSPIQSPELAKKYPLILNTGARVPEYTHWQMRGISALRRRAPDPTAEIHPDTAKKHGVVDGDLIFVETRKGQIKVKAKTTEAMMVGVVNVLHGWEGDANESVLTELEARDPVTGYTEMRALACRIRKS